MGRQKEQQQNSSQRFRDAIVRLHRIFCCDRQSMRVVGVDCVHVWVLACLPAVDSLGVRNDTADSR